MADDREQTDFEDLEEAVPAFGMASTMLVRLGERVGNLDVRPLGHRGHLLLVERPS